MPEKETPSQGSELTDAEMGALLRTGTYPEALDLFNSDIIIETEEGAIQAQFAELRLFEPISTGFDKLFRKFKRSSGQLFVPVRRGYPQPNLIVGSDPDKPSVIQISKVFVGGFRKSFGSLLKEHLPGADLDGYDLGNADGESKLRLIDSNQTPSLNIAKDTRGKALAVITRSEG